MMVGYVIFGLRIVRTRGMVRVLILAAGVLALMPIVAAAHDLVEPDWRGNDGTTFQQWTFDDNSNPVELDNAYGTATATITVGEYGEGWQQGLGFGEVTGIWDIGGTDGEIVVDIDNRPEAPADYYKEIWLQITYYTFAGLGDVPTITIPGAEFLSGETLVVEEDPKFGGNGWFLDQTKWRIEPNPDYEQITLTGAPSGSVIDQIVVDTTCIPEPATIALLALGTLMLCRKKRRMV
jgi:hypothetical protein